MSDDLKQNLNIINGQLDQLIQQSRQFQSQNSKQKSMNSILIILQIIIIIQLNSIWLIICDKNQTYSDDATSQQTLADESDQLIDEKLGKILIVNSTGVNESSYENFDSINKSNHLNPKILKPKYPTFEYKKGYISNDWSPTFYFHMNSMCGEIYSGDNFKSLDLIIFKLQEPFLITINPTQMTYSSFSNDCKYNFRLIGNEIVIYLVANKEYHKQATISYGQKQSPLVAKLSQDRQYLFVGGTDLKIQVWNFNNNELITEMSGHYGYVTDFIYVPKYNMLISSGEDFQILQWDVNNWKCTQVISAHSDTIKYLHLTKDQNYLVSISADQTMKIWSLPKLELLREIKTYIKPIGLNYDQEEVWRMYNGTHRLDIDIWKHIQIIVKKQN